MPAFEEQVRTLAETIQNTEAYQEFQQLFLELKEDVNLWGRMDAYRRLRLELETSDQELFEAGERLQMEFSDLFQNRRAKRFLELETEICRMIQYVARELGSAVSIHMSEFGKQ